MRHVNKAGLDLIKSFEKCVLHPYDDGAGYMTIGWGHLIRRGEHFDAHITQEEADELLRHDLADAESAVEHQVKVPLTENQFGALVSFTFNVGGGGLGRSSMLRALNRGEYAAVPERLMVWNKAGGKVLAGLTRRRKEEGHLFMRPDPPGSHDDSPAATPLAADDGAGEAVPVTPPAPTPDPAPAPPSTSTVNVETAGTVVTTAPPAENAVAQTTPGGGINDPTVKVTSGSGSWIRSFLTWIGGIFSSASQHVADVVGLSPDAQRLVVWAVIIGGALYLILKAVAEWQVRELHADPAKGNVK